MVESRQRSLERQHARTKDRVGALLVVLLAIVAGVVAAHFATPKPWEQPTAATSQVK